MTRRPTRLDGLRLVTVLGLLGCVAVSWPMWWPRQDIPLFPLHQGLAALPSAVGVLCMWGLLLCLAWLLFQPARGAGLLAAIFLTILVCLDLMRMQPWVFHFGCLLLILEVYQPRAEPQAAEPSVTSIAPWLVLCQLLHVGIYFWGGWHKFNPLFRYSLAFFFQPLPGWLATPLRQHWAPAIVVVVVEIGMAVALLLGRKHRLWRWLGLWSASIMHLLLIAFFLHIGYDANVIPWNAAMLVLTWLLFAAPPKAQPSSQPGLLRRMVATLQDQPPGRRSFAWGMVILCCILPGLHTFGWWDANLSYALYSNSYTRTDLLIASPHQTRLPKQVQPYLSPPTQRLPPPSARQKHQERRGKPTEYARWEANRWAMKRFRTTIPPTWLFGKVMFRTLCHRWPIAKQMRLEVHRSHWWGQTSPKPRLLRCPK